MSLKSLWAVTSFGFALAGADRVQTPIPTLIQLARDVAWSTVYFHIYETPISTDNYFMGIGQDVFPDGGTTNYM